MARYRKLPIEVDAVRWFPGDRVEGVCNVFSHAPYILTLEGRMKVSPGDWIITGIAGERYPCKREIFEKTYKLVETKG